MTKFAMTASKHAEPVKEFCSYLQNVQFIKDNEL